MMLLLILVMIVFVMGMYDVWIAGELGVGPRLGRSHRRRVDREGRGT